MIRRSGRTTEQIKNAPKNSVYIWVNADTRYPKQIAKKLGRDDIIFVSPSWLTTERVVGRNNLIIIVDHATWLEFDQYEFIDYAEIRYQLHESSTIMEKELQ